MFIDRFLRISNVVLNQITHNRMLKYCFVLLKFSLKSIKFHEKFPNSTMVDTVEYGIAIKIKASLI